MRRLRVVSQAVFFGLFLVLFFFAAVVPAAYVVPAPWFLRLNPLVLLTTSLASRSLFVPLLFLGGAVLVLTAVLGRAFCGFVCPLGALIDFSDRYLVGKGYDPKRQPAKHLQRLKYVLLTVVVVLALLGVTFPLFFDPISLLTRVTTLIAYPLLRLLGSEAAQLGRAVGIDAFSTVVVKVPLYYNGLAALVLLALVLGAGFWDRRFWCQYVCPSGALFGLLSRFALFRRETIAEGCNSCRRCTRCCPTRAIPDDVSRTSTAECIECGICTSLKEGCSRFALHASPVSSHTIAADAGRRHVLAGVLGGLALLPVLRADATSKRDAHGRLVRPPGAIPEDEFLARCIACGACMKVCPTKAIQPCAPSDGLLRVFTPRVVPRIGGCEEKCHACGYVCPTGALRELPYEEKQFVKIGTAVIDRHRCLAWSQNKECLVCDEICPYNAIEARVEQTTKGLFKVPVVSEDYCLGCGMCEQHCPINDTAAIVVYRFGEKRLSAGVYATDEEKEYIRTRRRKSDAHLSVDAVTEGTPESRPAEDGGYGEAAPEGGSSLPPGFTE